MDVYTEEFYQLLARTYLYEITNQPISRYVGDLRLPFQYVHKPFAPATVLEAHQLDVLLERQLTRRPLGPFVPSHGRSPTPSTSVDVCASGSRETRLSHPQVFWVQLLPPHHLTWVHASPMVSPASVWLFFLNVEVGCLVVYSLMKRLRVRLQPSYF